MKIDKAIANLRVIRKDAGMLPEDTYIQTIDLAIEALKHVKASRANPRHSDKPLPGED